MLGDIPVKHDDKVRARLLKNQRLENHTSYVGRKYDLWMPCLNGQVLEPCNRVLDARREAAWTGYEPNRRGACVGWRSEMSEGQTLPFSVRSDSVSNEPRVSSVPWTLVRVDVFGAVLPSNSSKVRICNSLATKLTIVTVAG